jgi:hypothetical protein
MKRLAKASLLPVLLLVFTITSCGKSSKSKETAPEKVQTAFKEKFPQATGVKWEKENDTEWEAEFNMLGKEYSANFNLDGQWQETEYEIAIQDIPTHIKASIDSTFIGYKIEEAEISEKGVEKTYEVKLEKNESTLEAVYDSNGVLVKQKEEDEKKDDKD